MYRANGERERARGEKGRWKGEHGFDHSKLQFCLCFNAFMSIIWPLFTIPLDFMHIFSNIFTSVQYTDAPNSVSTGYFQECVYLCEQQFFFTYSIPALSQRIAIILVLLFHFL